MRCGAGHRAFGETIGDTDSNRWGKGIVVGDWGVGSKVETAGTRVSDAGVIRLNMRGGICNILRR